MFGQKGEVPGNHPVDALVFTQSLNSEGGPVCGSIRDSSDLAIDTGGRVLRSRTLPNHNRTGQAFRQAAAAVTRSDCAFGALYRR